MHGGNEKSIWLVGCIMCCVEVNRLGWQCFGGLRGVCRSREQFVLGNVALDCIADLGDEDFHVRRM